MPFTDQLKRDYEAAVGDHLAEHFCDGGVSLTDAELVQVKLDVGRQFVERYQSKENARWLWFYVQHWASGREVLIQ